MRDLKISQGSWSKGTWISQSRQTILCKKCQNQDRKKRSCQRRPTGKGMNVNAQQKEEQMLRPRDTKVWSAKGTVSTFVTLGT